MQRNTIQSIRVTIDSLQDAYAVAMGALLCTHSLYVFFMYNGAAGLRRCPEIALGSAAQCP